MRHFWRATALFFCFSLPLAHAQAPRFAVQADFLSGVYPGAPEAFMWGGTGQLAVTYSSGMTLGALGYTAEQIRLDDNGARTSASRDCRQGASCRCGARRARR